MQAALRVPATVARGQRDTRTPIAMMLPYSIVFLIFWATLLLRFYAFGWPIGPGLGMRMG
jgi:p-aminobenzoyl-glutamate transporter AbgT